MKIDLNYAFELVFPATAANPGSTGSVSQPLRLRQFLLDGPPGQAFA
jgi:hypothetical protein